MKAKSIWQDKLSFDGIKLDKNIDVDVLIIGGGMTGLSTAYHLNDSNLKVALVDSNSILESVTTKSTGKITFLQDVLINIDDDYLDKYVQSQILACNLLEDIININNIECDYTKVKHRLCSNEKIYKLENLYNKIKKYGVVFEDNYIEAESAVFNPGKYLYGLKKCCKGVSIYENTRAYEILKDGETFIVKTNCGDIRCKDIVLATHYISFFKPFFLPIRSYLEKSYLCAVKTDKIDDICGISIDDDVIAYRYYKDYYIYLSECKNTSNLNSDESFKKMVRNFDDVSYVWSNKDIMTVDSMPYIGEIIPHVFCGTGYNTWGMTNGTLAGKIISGLILNNNNEYEFLNFNRMINIKNYIKFPMIINNTLASFFKTKLIKPKEKDVFYKVINGNSVAIYNDGNSVHAVYNRCPHLKCGVVFNKTENIWECPCHGSKFDIDGKCIEGPSNFDIKYKGNLDDILENE